MDASIPQCRGMREDVSLHLRALGHKVRSVRAQIRLGTLQQMCLPCAGKIGVYMVSSGYRPDYSGIAVQNTSEVAWYDAAHYQVHKHHWS